MAAVALGLAILVRTFLIQAYFIPSGSMENTLHVGDRVLVDKVVYDLRAPRRGEVVVFRGTDSWAPENPASAPHGIFGQIGAEVDDLIGLGRPGEKDFVKRVIGVAGDTVACCDAQGRVTVNGYPLDEPYITENAALDQPVPGQPTSGLCLSRRFGPVVVAPGMLFVMGDHRAVSSDSRCEGEVPVHNVIGKAIVVLWPHGHWATLGIPLGFARVPAAGVRPNPAQPSLSGSAAISPQPSPSPQPTGSVRPASPSPPASGHRSPTKPGGPVRTSAGLALGVVPMWRRQAARGGPAKVAQ